MKRLITALLSTSLTLTPVLANAQDHNDFSDEDAVGAVLFSLLALGVVAAIVSDDDDDNRDHDHHSESYERWIETPLPATGGHYDRTLPRSCVMEVHTSHGRNDVMPERCLLEEVGGSVVYDLPDECAYDSSFRGNVRTVYGVRCLRGAGYEIVGW